MTEEEKINYNKFVDYINQINKTGEYEVRAVDKCDTTGWNYIVGFCSVQMYTNSKTREVCVKYPDGSVDVYSRW